MVFATTHPSLAEEDSPFVDYPSSCALFLPDAPHRWRTRQMLFLDSASGAR
jgi:hypothetical protein